MDDVGEQARCLGCGYLLRGLSVPRCPECGRPYDPGDARTYRDPHHVAWYGRRWTILPPCLIIYGLCNCLALLDRTGRFATLVAGPVQLAPLVMPKVWVVIAIPCCLMAAAHPVRPCKATGIITVFGFTVLVLSGSALAWVALSI